MFRLDKISEISSSHGGEYEAENLLGCTAVFLIKCRPTFQRYVLLPSSGRDKISEISSFHGGEDEAENLLGCTAVFLIKFRPTFQRYVLPPS
jgi:hypothetical protein